MTRACIAAMKTDLDIVSEMLAHLVLCYGSAAELTERVKTNRNAVSSATSIVETEDTLLASDGGSGYESSSDLTAPPPSEDCDELSSPSSHTSRQNFVTTTVTVTSESTPHINMTTPGTQTETLSTRVPASYARSTFSPARSRPGPGPHTQPPVPGIPATVTAIDPTGPHHLFVHGAVSVDGRYQHMYNNFIYDLPAPTDTSQFYLITRGLRVGIFSKWAHASPYVLGVSTAIYFKVPSVDQGIATVMEAIDLGEARWLA